MNNFFIYADGAIVSAPSLLQEDEYAIDNPTVNLELNRAGSASFTMKSTHRLHNLLKNRLTKITVWVDDEPIFLGRVMNQTTNIFGDRQVYCEGALAYFNDSQQTPFNKVTKTPRKYLSDVIAAHNAQVEIDKRFTVGQITIDDADKNFDFEESGYSDTLSILTNTLVSRFGGYFNLRFSGDTIYIDWLKEYGHNCAQSIELGSNLVDYSEDDSLDDPWSVLLPYGNDGKKDITIASVNNGSVYLEDEELIALYGRIVKSVSFNTASSAQQLLTQAKSWIEKNKEKPTPTLSLTVLELHRLNPQIESFSLGDTILVQLPHLEKNSPYTCTQIEWNLFKPNDTKLTLGTPRQKLSDVYLSTKKDVKETEKTVRRNAQQTEEQIGDLLRDITVNAKNIAVNAENIEVNAKSIALNATNIKEIDGRVQVTEASIEVHESEIKLRAYQSDLLEVDKKVTTNSDAIGGLSEEQSRLMTRIGQAEITINGKDGQIGLVGTVALLDGNLKGLKGDFDDLSDLVDEVGEWARTAYIFVDGADASIDLKAMQAMMTDYGKRISEAEIQIDGKTGRITLNSRISDTEKILNAAGISIDAKSGVAIYATKNVGDSNYIGARLQVESDRITQAVGDIAANGELIAKAGITLDKNGAVVFSANSVFKVMENQVAANVKDIDANGKMLAAAGWSITSTGQVLYSYDFDKGVGSKVQQNADKIRLVVGDDKKIKVAEIVAGINDSGSNVIIKADHIELKGLVTASELQTVKGNIQSLISGDTHFSSLSVSGAANVGSLKIGQSSVKGTFLDVVTGGTVKITPDSERCWVYTSQTGSVRSRYDFLTSVSASFIPNTKRIYYWSWE